MIDVTDGSWIHKLPAYVMLFYALNNLIAASGLMNNMMPTLFGTTEEALPLMQGPMGRMMFLTTGISCTVIGLLFLPTYPEKKSPALTKWTFQLFVGLNSVFTLGILPLMYDEGFMGNAGIAQYGVMNCIFIGIAVLALTRM